MQSNLSRSGEQRRRKMKLASVCVEGGRGGHVEI